MLHRFPNDVFQQKLQRSQLDYVVSSHAAATSLAENYVGLPLRQHLQPGDGLGDPLVHLQPLTIAQEEVRWNSGIA